PLPICPPPCPDTETAPLPTPRTLTSRPQRTRPDPPAHRQPPRRTTTPAPTQLLIVDWSKPNPRPPEHRRTDPSPSLTSSSLTARSTTDDRPQGHEIASVPRTAITAPYALPSPPALSPERSARRGGGLRVRVEQARLRIERRWLLGRFEILVRAARLRAAEPVQDRGHHQAESEQAESEQAGPALKTGLLAARETAPQDIDRPHQHRREHRAEHAAAPAPRAGARQEDHDEREQLHAHEEPEREHREGEHALTLLLDVAEDRQEEPRAGRQKRGGEDPADEGPHGGRVALAGAVHRLPYRGHSVTQARRETDQAAGHRESGGAAQQPDPAG